MNVLRNLGGCPFLQHQPPNPFPAMPPPEIQKDFAEALKKINWKDVKTDIKEVLKDSKDFWPADYGHYGAFFVRMTWHATGTYRSSDGRGGADGGCQRMNPELSWDDNTNLVHAHKLLEPIKAKYGKGLSWGDLIVYAGTVAIEDMGGPVLGFAAGRIDQVDNSQTIALGPSEEQERFHPIAPDMDGKLEAPMGQNTMGLIYVNPEGPMGDPNPQGAADTIRDVFGRMGMGDRENVALIGGGHTFGKCHGAGPEGPGPKPKDCPHNPYPGLHGTGKGNDTVTSGLEGPWTSNPTKWDNEYFKNLVNYEWEKYKGPGGAWQWRVKGKDGPKAPNAQGSGEQDIIMLTTDIALKADPEYRKYVDEFAKDEKAYADAFAAVWYKLVNRDMGPVSRLVGPEVAPAQDWQFALPDPPAKHANMSAVEKEINHLLDKDSAKTSDFVRLVRHSASTFRHTDYLGGCNGALIRFSPGKDWKSSEGLDKVLDALKPIKEKFGDGLTWADLIVLAGNAAVKKLGAPKNLPFSPGRADAVDGAGWEPLEFMNAEPPKTVQEVSDRTALQGLSVREFVALSFPDYPTVAALKEMKASSTSADADMVVHALKYGPEFQRWVEFYIDAGDKVFANDFGRAWTKVMNSDRFDGPVNNTCMQYE